MLFRVGHGPGCGLPLLHATRRGKAQDQRLCEKSLGRAGGSVCHGDAGSAQRIAKTAGTRSEERRVGKECRDRWWRDPVKKGNEHWKLRKRRSSTIEESNF